MLLCNSNYKELSEKIKKENKHIIVYGSGMIGTVIIPYIIQEYDLSDFLYCFVDKDERKIGKKNNIGNKEYEICSIDLLKKIDDNFILLITNTKFYPIIEYLDKIKNLNDIEAYIIPLMQIAHCEQTDDIIVKKYTKKPVIPKVIHYCWFGRKELPDFLRKCISTWKDKCPDYDFIEWNESNYDVSKHKYTLDAYKNKKYGFVTDMARLDILYEYGGIYLDTDVTLVKYLDDMLYQHGFIGVEKWGNINSGGGCGFVRGHHLLKNLIEYRDTIPFKMSDGTLNIETNGMYETAFFSRLGYKPNNRLQIIDDVTIYPSYVQHPYDYMSCKKEMNDSTVSIHHFRGGWMEEEDRKNRMETQKQYMEVVRRIMKAKREADNVLID